MVALVLDVPACSRTLQAAGRLPEQAEAGGRKTAPGERVAAREPAVEHDLYGALFGARHGIPE